MWISSPTAESRVAAVRGRGRPAALTASIAAAAPGWAPGCAGRAGPPPSAAPSTCRTSSASRTARAGLWSATPAITAIRSPATGSPTPSATPSCWPGRSTRSLSGERDETSALSGYAFARNKSIGEIFGLTKALTAFPGVPRFVELQKRLSDAIEREALTLAALAAPSPRPTPTPSGGAAHVLTESARPHHPFSKITLLYRIYKGIYFGKPICPAVKNTVSRSVRSESRNTIRQDDTIESLRLAHDNGIKDTTRGAGAADTIHKGSPDVRGQVRTILHLIGEVRDAVPAHFHLRCADRDQGRRFKGELGHLSRSSRSLPVVAVGRADIDDLPRRSGFPPPYRIVIA